MKVGDTVFVGRGPDKGLAGRIVRVLKTCYRVRCTEDLDDYYSDNCFCIGEEYDVDKSYLDTPVTDMEKLDNDIREKSVELAGLFLKRKMLLNPEEAARKVEKVLETLDV